MPRILPRAILTVKTTALRGYDPKLRGRAGDVSPMARDEGDVCDELITILSVGDGVGGGSSRTVPKKRGRRSGV